MAKTNLTPERLREVFLYTTKSGDFVWRENDVHHRADEIAGTIHPTGYRMIFIDGYQYPAHRLAWLYVFGEWPRKTIDHINGVKDDNRIANLRDVGQPVNTQNWKKANANNKLGILGVRQVGRRFQARISLNGKQIFIGAFNSAEEAKAAYLSAKRRLHIGCTI